jgi:probable HAF family extracellular repeat protein
MKKVFVSMLVLLTLNTTTVNAVSFHGLGTLAQGGHSQAGAVSHDGKTIVGSTSSSSGTVAYRWNQVQGMQVIGDLPGGDYFSSACGVSSDGSYVVGCSSSSKGIEAFVWHNGQISALGDLTASSYYSTASDVSDDGSVIVGRTNANPYWPNNKLLIWNDSAISTYSSYQTGIASSVTSNGEVIVGCLDGQAFQSINGTINFLGDLPGGNFYSVATSMSNDGTIIVGEGNSYLGQEAFFWKNGIMGGLGFLPNGSCQVK